MARQLLDLIKEAGGGAEEEVTTAVSRWRQQLRELTRTLTGLKLSHKRTGEREQWQVPIRIRPGLPDPLKTLAQEQITDEDRYAIEVIGMWAHDLRTLRQVSRRLKGLTDRLDSLPSWSDRAWGYDLCISQAGDVAEELEAYAKQAELLKRLVGINEDVLGIYRFWDTPRTSAYGLVAGEIEIYWLVIGTVSRLLGVSAEALTVVVLAHELSHAYTHLGMDIDGKRWEKGFASDLHITEGLAQYYTHLAMERLAERDYHDGTSAYRALLDHQTEPYKAHLRWVNREYTPEVVRGALLAAREIGTGMNIWSFNREIDAVAAQLRRGRVEDQLSLL